MFKNKLNHALGLLALGAAILAGSETAYAVNSCRDVFSAVAYRPVQAAAPNKEIGKVTISAMGEPDKGARIKKEADIIARVANELGLATPAHFLQILPSAQLDALASSGGHPAPHWHDGSEIIRSKGQSRGVLEFVTSGCAACRAFYSASTDFEEQRSILMHVAGHNDMSSTSEYQTRRPNDGPLSSYQLAQAVSHASRHYNHSQVALYFQYLKSFQQLQDYTYGMFDDPSQFSPERANSALKAGNPKSNWETVRDISGGFFDNLVPQKKTTAPAQLAGWKETTSVLQAMTEMLPVEAPDWQRTLIRLFENTNRAYPGNFQTKIMNEGWATLQQYLIAKHVPGVSSADLIKYASLMSGVAWQSFTNPYWLGVSGWMNIYEQYMERPELQNLSQLEKDKRFVSYARTLYGPKNDSQFVKIAIDQRWIEKNRFFLYRPTLREEMDPNVDPKEQKLIALSRDWKRIRNFIISKYVDNKLEMIPSLKILNPYHTNGVVTLVQNTQMGIPIEITTATKTLFVIAQVLHRPTELRAIFEKSLFVKEETQQDPNEWWRPPPPPKAPETIPGKIRVSMTGEVSLEIDGQPIDGGSKQLEEVIDAYKTDVLGSFGQSMANDQLRKWTKITSKIGDNEAAKADASLGQIVDYAPHAGPAVREYLQLVEKRLRKAIELAIAGQSNINLTGRGISLPVLPEIPSFHYSNRYIQQRNAVIPPAPVDRRGYEAVYDFHVDRNGTGITQGNKLPGDKWGPKEDEGQGKGKGKGKGKKSDEEGDEDGDEPGEGTGGGSQSPRDIQIPLKLYGESLAQVLDLPNIRRTLGGMTDPRTLRRGVVAKPTGLTVWEDTIEAAVQKVRALRKSRGEPYGADVPYQELIPEAMALMESGDHRTYGEMEKPLPDFDAVLIVNVDMTGSMAGERIKNAKNLVYNMKALLMAKYKKVKIVYVGFDSDAAEMTEKEVFSQFRGGGTNYTSAAKLDQKIFEERFPTSKYNRYLVTIGDAETAQSDADSYINVVDGMKDTLQYAGLAVTNESMNSMTDALVHNHERLQRDWPWVGIAKLRSASDMMQALKDLFKGDGKKK